MGSTRGGVRGAALPRAAAAPDLRAALLGLCSTRRIEIDAASDEVALLPRQVEDGAAPLARVKSNHRIERKVQPGALVAPGLPEEARGLSPVDPVIAAGRRRRHRDIIGTGHQPPLLDRVLD